MSRARRITRKARTPHRIALRAMDKNVQRGFDLTVVPKGNYCYEHTAPWEHTPNGPVFHIRTCPYWSIRKDKPPQDNGYCSLLQEGDWEGRGFGLLWDQIKSCGISYSTRAQWAALTRHHKWRRRAYQLVLPVSNSEE